MKYKKEIILLCIITALAVFLRFFHLASNPPSMTWDEVAWGYNAYALGIDGKDEFGRFLPHDYLESFGDFKPPMYAYLAIVPVKIFGLTAFATRFPSAFFGSLTVIITYFLIKRLFPASKYEEWYALTSSLILAVSPWHIMLSRAAFEANVGTFYIVTGVFLFLCGVQSSKWKSTVLLSLSAASFVASMYTFNTERIVAPLLAVMLTIGFWKPLWKDKRSIIFAAVVGFILLLPTLPFLLSPQAKLRFKEVNIFSDASVVKTSNQEIANDHNAWWSKLIHNRRLGYGVDFVQHYLDNLTPNFLFIHGDGNPKFSIQDTGQMYLWDIPFIIFGAFFLFKNREGNWWLIPIWLLLAIIPAATARETPHALRIEASLPTFQILSAYGLVQVITNYELRIMNYGLKKLFVVLVMSLLFVNILYFQHDYFVYYPKTYSGEWQYGYEQSIGYVMQHYHEYDSIQVTSSLGRPYIYYLFFTKTSPDSFRKTAKISRDPFGFVTVEKFDKYTFLRGNKKQDNVKTLFIDVPIDTSSNAHIVQTFYMLNGQPILHAYSL